MKYVGSFVSSLLMLASISGCESVGRDSSQATGVGGFGPHAIERLERIRFYDGVMVLVSKEMCGKDTGFSEDKDFENFTGSDGPGNVRYQCEREFGEDVTVCPPDKFSLDGDITVQGKDISYTCRKKPGQTIAAADKVCTGNFTIDSPGGPTYICQGTVATECLKLLDHWNTTSLDIKGHTTATYLCFGNSF